MLENAETAHDALAAAVLPSLTTLLGFWGRPGCGITYGHGTAVGMAAGASLLATLKPCSASWPQRGCWSWISH